MIPGIFARISGAWPGALSILLALGGWAFVSAYFFDKALLPGPLAVSRTASQMVATGEVLDALRASLGRVAIGYIMGVAAGLVTGLLLGGVRIADAILGPLFEFLKGLPPIALVPLAILWFGIGEFPKHLIIAYIVWIVVAVNTAAGVREISMVHLRAGRFLGLSGFERFRRIMLPSVASYLLVGIRTGIGFAFVALISAEIIAADSGIGFIIMDSRFSLQTARMIVGLILLTVVGAATQAIFDLAVERSRFLARYWRH